MRYEVLIYDVRDREALVKESTLGDFDTLATANEALFRYLSNNPENRLYIEKIMILERRVL